MEASIRERISQLINVESLNTNSFAKKIGLNPSVLATMFMKGTEPSVKTLSSILVAFPKVSAEWLMRGDGEMYRDECKVSIDVSNSAPVAVGSGATAGSNDCAKVIESQQRIIEQQQDTINKLLNKIL